MTRMICQTDPSVRLVAAADVRATDEIRERMGRAEIPDHDEVELFDHADRLLEHADRFDGILIGTSCDLHAPMAIKAAAAGLPVYLEKPVAISWDQVCALGDAFRGREDAVVVSFPLRLTVHVQTALEIITSGRLGTINQVQAVNNVPYGGVYFGQWYRDYAKTGGLWLQKATHDFDYVTQLVGSRPMRITAMHSRLAYGGEMPAGLTCSRCDRTEVCPESPKNLARRGFDGGTLMWREPTPDDDHACNFGSDILHQDAGSAIILYESGAHASYVQNFLPRRSAGLRGATVIGYDATLQFSWQSKVLRVIEHHLDKTEEIPLQAGGSHGGGDAVLARNFVDVMRGRAPSRSPLSEGLLSAAMCLAARDAAATGVAQPIPPFSVDARSHHTGPGPIEPPRGDRGSG